MSPFQGSDSNLNLTHRSRGGLNNFALRAFSPWPNSHGACSSAHDPRRMEEQAARKDGAAGNGPMSLFALSFLQEVG
jgi:hypothetical protein